MKESSIARSMKKITEDRKQLGQIAYFDTFEYIDFWQEITLYSNESTNHFINMIKKLDDLRSGDDTLISRFKQLNTKKV